MNMRIAVVVLALAACTTPPGQSPGQDLVNTTASSCKGLGSAIVATDAAVGQKLLTKAQALEAIKGFEAAQLACKNALGTIQAAQPAASGVKP